MSKTLDGLLLVDWLIKWRNRKQKIYKLKLDFQGKALFHVVFGWLIQF